MDNQQPGQTVQPGQDQNQPPQNQPQSATQHEINDIDQAVNQHGEGLQSAAPPQPPQTPPLQTATDTTADNAAAINPAQPDYSTAANQDAENTQENAVAAAQQQPAQAPDYNAATAPPTQSQDPAANTAEAAQNNPEPDTAVAAQAASSTGQEVQIVDGVKGQLGLGDNLEDVVTEEPLLAWQAAEPARVPSANPYALLVLALVALLFIGVTLFIGGFTFGSFLSIVTIAIGLFTLVYASRYQSQLQDYAIYESGVQVGNQYYNFWQLRSFVLVTSDTTASVVELIPAQRTMFQVAMHLDSTSAEQAIAILEQKLPREDREPTFIDRLSNGI